MTSGAVRVATTVVGTDPFALVDALSAKILAELNVQASGVRKVAEVTSSSTSAYKDYTAGVEALRQFRRADARRFLDAAVAQDPGFALAHLELSWLENLLGQQNARRARLGEAAKHLDRISERDGLLIRAETAIIDVRLDDAEQLLESLIARYPDTEAAYIQLGYLFAPYGARPNLIKQAAIFTRGVQALPYSSPLKNALGYALVHNGQFDAARRELETQIKLRPSESNPLDSLAEAHLAIGQIDQAIKRFTEANAISGNSQKSGRGWSHAVLGKYDEALSDLPQVTFVRRAVLTRLGRYRESELEIDEAKQAHKSAGDFRNLAGLSLLQALNDLERGACGETSRHVAEAAQATADQHRDEQRPWLAIGMVLEGWCQAREQNLEQARGHLNRLRILHFDGSPMERWWVRGLEGEIALAAGDAAGATPVFSAGEAAKKMIFGKDFGIAPLSFFANNLLLRDGRARAAAVQGRPDEAIRQYRELLTPGRESKWTAMLEPRYVLALARLLDRAGSATPRRRSIAASWSFGRTRIRICLS